jgi:uncharacterized protein with NRDE domain
MCVAAFAIGMSERWPLVLASNRDEFHARPTAPLARWRSNTGLEIISGRDMRDGGTWLGFTGARVALLTNVREGAPKRGARSRGELALQWLDTQKDAASFHANLNLGDYGGFNLVLGDWRTDTWHYFSNREGGALQTLGRGIYGLSNATLDTPWPKTKSVKELVGRALTNADTADLGWDARLLDGLTHHQPALEAALPQTGVPLEWERALSSVFVQMPDAGYGTRCSTVAVVSASASGASLSVTERTHPHALTAWPQTRQESVPLAPGAPHRSR